MTRDEVKRMIHIIVATYPNFKSDNLTDTVDAWYFFLAEYSGKDVADALRLYVSTSGKGFPPSVDQIISLIHKPKENEGLTEGVAWSLVMNAISRSTYYSEEEFAKFPAEVQQAVGSPSQLKMWAMDENFNQSVVMSNFQRAYRAVMDRKRFERKPESIKIEGSSQKEIGQVM